MLHDIFRKFSREQAQDVTFTKGSLSLQIVLWTIWTLTVAGVAVFTWHAAIVAQRPLDLLGLVIHCVLAGLIGLIVMTKIEMYLERWRFIG